MISLFLKIYAGFSLIFLLFSTETHCCFEVSALCEDLLGTDIARYSVQIGNVSLPVSVFCAEYDALAKVIQQHPDRQETMRYDNEAKIF